MGENSETSERCESTLRSNAGNGYELQHAGTRLKYLVPVTGGPIVLCRLHADMLGDAVHSTAVDAATDDDVNVLVDRIVHRAQYTALREVLTQIDLSDADGDAWFGSNDFRQMLNDAARNLRTALPVTAADE